MLQSPAVKAIILDAGGVSRAWRRIAHELGVISGDERGFSLAQAP